MCFPRCLALSQFGFYGPIAFDVAKVIANLLLTVFATYGLEGMEPNKTSRADQRGDEGSREGGVNMNARSSPCMDLYCFETSMTSKKSS